MGFYLFLSHILWLLRKAAIKIMLVDRLKVIIHVFIYHYADMNFILSVRTYCTNFVLKLTSKWIQRKIARPLRISFINFIFFI